MQEASLQQDSVIYLSAGFDGPFVMQAFSVRKLPLPAVGLQMCLTDGKVYIGAKYNSGDYPEVQDYWLLQITAKFISQNQPIIIKTLQVISTFPKKMLGHPPCTLMDYFNKQINRPAEQRLGQPSKKVKYSNAFDLPLLKNSDNKKPAQKQKPSAQFTTISPSLYKKKQQPKVKNQSDKKTTQKKLKLADSEEQSEEQQKLIQKKQNGGSAKKQACIQIVQGDDGVLKNCLISDLYQRKTQWVILCRINYLNMVQCKNQLNATNFMLNDEVGNEIKCVYFENPLQPGPSNLQVDKYYSFSKGQISRTQNKSDGVKQLQIIFDRQSLMIERQNIQFDMNLSKFCRIANIPLRQPTSQINVIGIIKNIKFLDQSNKNKFRYNSTICDPLSGYQIDLILFLNHHQKPPQKGTIGFLHNYQLFKQNNVCRLNSSYKSYFRQEKKFKDPITSQLKKAKQSKQRDWENINYKNLSSIPFAFRTVKDLKRVIHSTDDQKVYSLIDCWVLDISKKKFYHACKNCKKGTDKKDSGVFYCPNCQRNVQTFYCHTLSATFADYTSHFSLDVIGQHAQTLLELKNLQFHGLSHQKQLAHLDSLKCKNVTLKLKTQRRDKRQSHSVWAIESSNAINSLKQIRRKLQEKKLRIDEKW